MKVTPKTLEQAPIFSDVTKSIFSSIITPPNWREMSALDGDRVWNPVRGQGAIYMEYFNAISPLCVQLKNDFPQAINLTPNSFFELIEFIAKGLGKFETDTSSLAITQNRTNLIKRMQEIDKAACALLSEGKIDLLFEEAKKLEDENLTKMIGESVKAVPDLDIVDLKGMVEATNKQISARSQLLEHYKYYPPGICLTLDKWLKLTKTTIDHFNQRKQLLSEILNRLGCE